MSPLSTEVAVVGGGIVGLATAWTLARAGMDVALFDAAALGGGASGAAQGGVGVAPWMSGFDLAWQRHAIAVFERMLEGEDDLDCGPPGALFVAEGDAADVLRQQLDALAAAGMACEWLDGPALRAAEPALAHRLVGAAYLPHSRNIDIAALLALVARRAEQAGARLFAHEQVERIRTGGRKVQGLETAERVVNAAQVVLAAGTGSPALLAGITAAPAIVPQRGCVIEVAMPKPAVRHYVIEARYAVSLAARPGSERSIATVLQPARGKTLRVGSSREFVGLAPAAGDTLGEAVLARARQFVPGLSTLPIESMVVGFRPWTADNRPFVGPLADIDGLFLAAGHNGEGVATALATAARLAADISRSSDAPPPELRPGRVLDGPSSFSSAEHP